MGRRRPHRRCGGRILARLAEVGLDDDIATKIIDQGWDTLEDIASMSDDDVEELVKAIGLNKLPGLEGVTGSFCPKKAVRR